MRFLVLLVVVAALGGGLWMLLGGDGTGADTDPYGLVDPTDSEEARRGPSLQGDGRALAVPKAEDSHDLTGDGVIHVRVLDMDGKPLAGVQVVCRLQQLRPAGYRQSPLGRWRSMTARSRSNRPTDLREVGRQASDVDGRVRFEGLAHGSYTVRGEAAPPELMTTASAFLSRWSGASSVVLHRLRGTPLTLRVRAADGTTPASAMLRLQANVEIREGVKAPWEGWIQVDGEARFAAVPAGEILAKAWPDPETSFGGYKSQAPTEDPFVIVLPRGSAAVRGTVLDEEERPLAGVEIHVRVQAAGASADDDEMPLSRSTRSDTSGRYEIENLPDGAVTVVGAHKPGYGTYWKTWKGEARPAVSTAEPFEHDIPLVRTGSIGGQVTLRGSGPVIGADVYVFRIHSRQSAMTPGLGEGTPVKTDASGRYRVEDLALGTYLVLPDHPSGWYPPIADARGKPSNVTYGSQHAIPESVRVLLTLEARNATRDLELLDGLRLRGRVVDDAGTPVEGATVRALQLGPQEAIRAWTNSTSYSHPRATLATTEADGFFETSSVPYGDKIQLYATKEGMIGKVSDAFDLAEGGSAPGGLELVLEPAATLEGRVLDADGEPLSGVRVQCWGTQHPTVESWQADTTDDEGVYRIEGVPPGDHRVMAWGSQGHFAFDQLEVKGVTKGEVRTDLDIQAKSTCVVSGTLRTSRGEPVADQHLLLREASGMSSMQTAKTDEKGHFTFGNAPIGQVQFHIQMPASHSYEQIGKTIEAPAEGVELTYDPPAEHTFQLRVVGPDGKPIPRCTAECAKNVNSQVNAWMRKTTTVQNGEASITAVGTFPMKLRVDAARDEADRPLNLAPHEQTLKAPPSGVVEVRLSAGLEIGGRVTDEQGKPLAAVPLFLEGERASTDDQGRFTFKGLAKRERYVVQVLQFGDYIQPKPRVLDKPEADIEFQLAKGLSISGRVEMPGGQMPGSVYMQASWNGTETITGGTRSGKMGQDGEFEVSGIPAGAVVKIRVQVFSQGAGAPAPKTIEGVAAGTRNLVIHMDAGQTIGGHIFEPDGSPASDVMVVARGGEGMNAYRSATSKSDGSFEIGGLPDGKIEVYAQTQSPKRRTKTYDVDAGTMNMRLQFVETASLKLELADAVDESVRVRVYASGRSDRVLKSARLSTGAVTTVEGLEKGQRYHVRGSGTSSYFELRDVTPGTTVHRLVARPGQVIRGNVEAGDAAPQYLLVVIRGNGWYVAKYVQPRAGKTTWDSGALPPGPYDVELFNDGKVVDSKEAVQPGSAPITLRLR